MKNSKLNYLKQWSKTHTKEEVTSALQQSPLKATDVTFMMEVLSGATYKELMCKYNLSMDGIYKRKVRCADLFCYFCYYHPN